MLKKNEIEDIVVKVSNPKALYLEQWLSSKNGSVWLCANTNSGGKRIGKVSIKIFNWYHWDFLDQPYLNVKRWKYVGPGNTEKPKTVVNILN